MGEVNGWVTHTALAIRDEDELEVAASMLDAALRRAKAEVWREAATHVLTCMRAVDAANDFDDRAAQIEEGE